MRSISTARKCWRTATHAPADIIRDERADKVEKKSHLQAAVRRQARNLISTRTFEACSKPNMERSDRGRRGLGVIKDAVESWE